MFSCDKLNKLTKYKFISIKYFYLKKIKNKNNSEQFYIEYRALASLI